MYRLVIAGTESGAGKTTITIGLMAALMKKGFNVQGFKCGPDYIDPSYHTAVTGRVSRNLDSWMLNPQMIKEIVNRASEGADISIIEGVMGLFDGENPMDNTGSTADISIITQSPVILIVNCSSMARSAAAIVKGFQLFSKETNLVGVIANNVGSEGHFNIVKIAIEQECGIPVLGYLKTGKEITLPERHLGLIPSVERGDLDGFFDQLGNLVLETINIDQLLKLAKAPPLEVKKPQFREKTRETVRIALAKDAAFNFYYQENLELLESYGGKLIEFSPLAGETLPENVDGLYIGGGFPEEFAQELSEQKEVKQSIYKAIESGLPTFAECGGFMFLTEMLETSDHKQYEMTGIIPGSVKMQTGLAALGYREIKGMDGNFLIDGTMQAKGHEFHYSTYSPRGVVQHAYEVKGMNATKHEGYMKDNLVAGYTHFHFGSCPRIAEKWIEKCLEHNTRFI